MPFVQQHLDFLLAIPLTPQGAVGVKLRPWAKDLKFASPGEGIPQDILDQLPGDALDRDKLRSFCLTAGIQAAFLAISAWGGMNRLHGARAWLARDSWEPVLKEIRASENSRGDDYNRLHQLRLQGGFPGVGIPYFTKLLFFLRQRDDAYIMDQWTAKSVNLLTGRSVVDVNEYGWVVDTNDHKRYEDFCDIVDQLAGKLNTDGSSAEHALISRGGRRSWPWRQYVRTHFPKKKAK